MLNLIISIFASILVLIGLASMVTPIPGGIIMISGGLTTLICSSPRAQFCIRFIRTRTAWFNKAFFWLEGKMGKRVKIIGDALAKTRPEKSQQESSK